MNAERQNRSSSRRKRRKHKGQWSQRYSSNERFHKAESHEASAPGSSLGPGHDQNDKTKSQAGMPGQIRHRDQQVAPASGSRTWDVSNPQSSTNSHQSDPRESDIPGYYYDEEAKLYFKIQSYNLGMVAPFITKDKIVSQQKESQRIKDIQKLTKKNLPASATSFRSGVTALKQSNHILTTLKNVQCGQFTCENMRTYMIRHMCSRIQPDLEWDNSLPAQPSLLLGEAQNMEVSKNRDKIACVSALKSSYSQVIQLMTVEEKQHSQDCDVKRTNVRIQVPLLAVGPIHKRIKTMCWAPLTGRHGQSTILYTTACPIGCLASIAYLSNLEAETEDERILFEFNLGKHLIWSSAWNKHGHKFTIGAERKCCLIDVTTRKQWTFSTLDSDPLSQLFSHFSPFIYNGTRKGQILLHDIRSPEMGGCTVMMKQAPGIGCLRLLKDENYLLAGDFSGTICTWDQRMRKKVLEYKGLMNSYWQLPFYLDETESLLTSTGSDSYTQIWDVKTGDILRRIPPMYQVSCDSFPLSFYSTRWGGRDGNSALLVAMRNRFRFYTYKET